MKTTNRRWQNHLRAKGIVPFFLDRLAAHALSSAWQHDQGPFHFPIPDRDLDDELTRAFFEFAERFPFEIYIEVTNECNLACTMCARRVMTRPTGFMADALFRRIIDEISEKQPHAYVHYYGIGEPLLDEHLIEKLAYARSRNICNSVLFTNGQLLSRNDAYKALARSGVSTIGVDLDAFSQELYGKIRVGGRLDLAREGIERLYEYVRRNDLRTRVEIAYQIYPGLNEGDIGHFVAWCDTNEYEYKLVTLHNWAGLRDDLAASRVNGLAEMHHAPRTCPCCALWRGFMIAWDGRVGLCFQDANLSEMLGDVNTRTIEQVWKQEHLRKRRAHVDGVFEGLCETCDSFAAVELPARGSDLYPASLRSTSHLTECKA